MDKPNFEGATPLMYAAALGDDYVGPLEVLIKGNATLDLVADNGTMRGTTALSNAAGRLSGRRSASHSTLAPARSGESPIPPSHDHGIPETSQKGDRTSYAIGGGRANRSAEHEWMHCPHSSCARWRHCHQ